MEPVQVERFYLGCLAHASYMIGSKGIAAVIDPQRDADIYLEAAARMNLKIEYIIETHVHADFVSGHRELAGGFRRLENGRSPLHDPRRRRNVEARLRSR
jgi:glyoxylase-like metal-dependent hydrolase (beta-lactamase superfamily II)